MTGATDAEPPPTHHDPASEASKVDRINRAPPEHKVRHRPTALLAFRRQHAYKIRPTASHLSKNESPTTNKSPFRLAPQKGAPGCDGALVPCHRAQTSSSQRARAPSRSDLLGK